MTAKAITNGWSRLTGHRYFSILAYLALLASSLVLLPDLESPPQGDVSLYNHVSQDLVDGKLPYRDRTLEYPPYVVPLILVPKLVSNAGLSYGTVFKYNMYAIDFFLKLMLFWIGLRSVNKARSFLPLFCYCWAIPFLHFFLLQRYDLWPALICTVALCLFCSGRVAWAGVLFAIGVGVKIYPIVFLPPLFILAARQGKARPFCAGVVAGLLPMLLLSFVLPWWRFAQFQGNRGLQCESLYASFIWFAKQLGVAPAQWCWVKAWYEVQGPVADLVLPWSRLMFAGTVIFSMGWVTWVAACSTGASLGRLARLLLIPLLAFVAFNQVLSPQYLIWILPLAALTLLEGRVSPAILLTLATMPTQIIFPSFHDDYARGLNPLETLVLVLRNVALVSAWLLLVRETLPGVRQAGWTPWRRILDSFAALLGKGPATGPAASGPRPSRALTPDSGTSGLQPDAFLNKRPFHHASFLSPAATPFARLSRRDAHRPAASTF